MSKSIKTSAFILLAVISLIANSCQSPMIKPSETMKYMYEISEGQELAIEWNFENANLVRIEGMDGSFFAKGAVIVKPEKSRTYKLTAFKGFSDSLVCVLNVDVVADDFTGNESGEIRTGDIVLKEHFTEPSKAESEYLNGIVSEDKTEGTSEMKVLRVRQDAERKFAYADVLLLDKFGNYISGFGKKNNKIVWNATNQCGGITANYSNLEFKEITNNKKEDNLDLSILIDNSMFSISNNLAQSLHSSIAGMNSNDNIMFASFSEEYDQITGLTPAEHAYLGFSENFVMPDKRGFSASLDALLANIKQLAGSSTRNKAIVLITSVSDNASVKTSIDEIANEASKLGISVNVIGIGDAVDGFELKQLCMSTGGKYYLLLPDETEKVGNIISELIFSFSHYYRVSIPLQNFSRNCLMKSITLNYVDSRLDLTETINLAPDSGLISPKKIIACGFDAQSVTIGKEYFRNLNRIANLLKNDTNVNIVLTGFGWGDGPKPQAQKLAQMRAEAIRSYLIDKGIRNNFAIHYSTGLRPMFPSPKSKQFEELNRRVELSFKDIQKDFYELIVETVESETLASARAVEWEKRGFKAYFVRSPEFSPVTYQVRLWGYNSKSESEKVAATLKSKYKINPIIE
jgi:outer membrane protein OmpA-like peptidoglycan-associated protein